MSSGEQNRKRVHAHVGRLLSGLAALAILPASAGRAEQHPAITYSIRPPGTVTGFAGDARGNVYVVGTADATFRTTPGVAYPTRPSGPSSYLLKLDSNGEVVFGTYLPGVTGSVVVDRTGAIFVVVRERTDGPIDDRKPAVISVDAAGASATSQRIPICPPACGLPMLGALDGAGNLYVASASGLPVTPDARRFGPDAEVFVVKMNPRTGTVIYAAHIGGSRPDSIRGLAADAAGNAYVAGQTDSIDFPVTPNAYMTTAPQRALFGFVSKLNPAGTALVYSTYLDASGANCRGRHRRRVHRNGRRH
jgi:hypothetical protein